MISYDGLMRRLNAKGLTKTGLAHELGISSRTIAKIGRGEPIARHVLVRIAEFLECTSEDLCQSRTDNVLLQTLRDEKNVRLSGGLYHELQVRLTYNSNHIEGSQLSEDQTRFIFETNTLGADSGLPVDDIIETSNHFRGIDFVIDRAEQPLNEEIIKELHRILKQGTTESSLEWFAVGDYKRRPNMVGGRETAKPQDVASQMKQLLSRYESLNRVEFDDIVELHYQFELIHPFQDGNGRVGRLIALKECLRHEIVPFIIEDSKKLFYYRGLSHWENEKGYLRETCLDGQDTFIKLMSQFGMQP
ncbi:Fic family protein [Mobiluncus sp.]|uniref:Fic family protein n=1 Tax=Mobiluncus sp. TaxID=47293 RepID=UPI002A918224|nr:Fic family protein [Mobiluncus sp.]MDY6077694.1 Fic family protein [Mobiluncus sp.]